MNKWLRVVVILIVLALLFIPTIIVMKYIAISQIYSYFVDSISNLTGFNRYLVKAAVALMLVPLLMGLKFLFSINKKRRSIGMSILATLLILYNLSLYHFTRDLYFSFSEGNVLKWYALTSEGVKYFDGPGVDPVYGIPLRPVTPDVIRNLKLIERGDFRPIDPKNTRFFNPITSDPQVWYHQYPDGGFEFYDKPGYHPITGDPLKPVNKQIYFEWQEKEKSKENAKVIIQQKERQAAGRSLKSTNEEGLKEQQFSMNNPKIPAIDEQERRLSEFKSLINQGIAIYPGKANIAMVIESRRTESGISPENLIYNHLSNEKINIIINFFKEESFKTKGYFKEIYDIDTKLLRQTDVLSKIDYLILGRLNYSFQKGGGLDTDLVSCNINLSYKIINKNADVVRSDSIRVVGPGFSEDAAIERGLEMLSEQYSDRIIKSIL